MTAKIIPLSTRLDCAWADYIEARQKAEATGDIVAGIEAGRAWRRWLDLFMTPDQRQTLDANAVVSFGR